MAWNPFGVSLEISAIAGTVTRISATQFTVNINASWKTYYNGAETNYGMDISSGGVTKTINKFGGYHSSGSGSLTGTYSISGNGAASKTITVTFRNYNTDNDNTASKSISLSVSVPAWTSYTVSYNANGGSGAPGAQTKWKDQTLKLSTTKPTRTGHSFQGWATSAGGGVAYASGANYTGNASITLYAVWKANTYTVSYNANGGGGAPGAQTKTYGVTLKLSSTIPSRTNYTFVGWGTSASSTTVSYNPGGNYTGNAAITLYAIWELTYVKPRITNLSVTRCDSSGNMKIDGDCALLKFSWASDRSGVNIHIQAKFTTESGYEGGMQTTGSGTSGSFSQVLRNYQVAYSYNIRVTVADSVDSTSQEILLNSMMFTIHARPGGRGIAFGKMSEHDDVVDVGWDIELNDNDVFRNGELAYSPVQKISGTYLTTAGWYRVGKLTINNCFRIAVSTNYGNNPDIASWVDIVAPYRNPNMSKFTARTGSNSNIDQIRLVKDSSEIYYYVDIHYTMSQGNYAYILIYGPYGLFEQYTTFSAIADNNIDGNVALTLSL